MTIECPSVTPRAGRAVVLSVLGRSALALALAIAGTAAAAPNRGDLVAADLANATDLADRPDRTWSGRLMARPRTPADLVASGLAADAPAAARRTAGAIARLEAAGPVARRVPTLGVWSIDVGPDRDAAAARLAALRATGDYHWVEPDWRVHATGGSTPDDPSFPVQWHLERIDAPAAWATATGDPSVVIAVCDSGVDLDHPDLIDRLVPGYNAVDDLPQVDGGLVDGLTDHGTQVAGSAAASGDNGLGVAGVGWSFSVMPVRVSNLANDTAFLTDLAAGAIWAAENGAQVVNVSFSGVTASIVADAGAAVRAAGSTLVWSAGNASTSLGVLDLEDVVVVGATDADDAPATFTNFGRMVDVVAPGVDVFTTNLGGYGPINGTSFSAPITAGLLGLVHSVDPSLPAASIEAIVRATAVDLGATGEDDQYGAGRIDAAAAVALAAAAAAGDVAPLAFDDRLDLGFVPDDGGPPPTLVIDVLANDVELDGQALAIAVTDATSAAGATITIDDSDPAGDRIIYAPPAGYEGVDSFAYIAADETGNQAAASVQVVVVRTPSFADQAWVDGAGIGSAQSIIAHDLDGDGDDDLIASHGSTFQTLHLYENVSVPGSGNGPQWVDAGTISLETFDIPTVQAGDVDGDGNADLVTAHPLAGTIGIVRGHGDLTFAAPQYLPMPSANDVVIADEAGTPLDFDGDGITDLAVATAGFPATIQLLRGVAGEDGLAETWTTWQTWDPSETARALRATDMNGDGIVDLVGLGIAFQVVTFLRDETGMIVDDLPAGGIYGPQDMVVRDLDDDGDADVGVCLSGFGGPPGVVIFRNEGTGQLIADDFVDASGANPRGLAAGDFDGDGDVDLTAANLLSNDLGIHPAVAGGVYPAIGLALPTSGGPSDVIAVDGDGDGDLDLVAPIAFFGARRLAVLENLSDPAPPATGDVDGDGAVGFTDLLAVLAAWGPCPGPPTPCPADVDGSGGVDFGDVLTVLANWSA